MNPAERQTNIERFFSIPTPLILIIVLSLTALSYGNSLYSPFALDDYNVFVESSDIYVHDFSWQSIKQLSNTPFGKGRLIPIITFAIDGRLGQGNIFQFHVTNILIHILATTALFVFLTGLMKTSRARQALEVIGPGHYCLFVSALWALSPVQTNAVTYLVQRMASLVSLFYLSSLAFYIYARLSTSIFRRVILFMGSVFCAILAFFSKENWATLPLAALLIEWIFLSPDLPRRIRTALKWRHVVLLIIFMALLLPLGAKPWQDLTSSYDIRHFTLGERLLTEARVVVFYISLLALPLPGRLNLDHDFPVSHSLLAPPTTLLSILLLAGLLGLAFRYRNRWRLVAFGFFWFFLHLLIESTVIPLELIFEHRLYLSSPGFFMATLSIMDLAVARLQKRKQIADLRTVVLLFLVLFSSFSALLTTLRNHDWRDLLTLYSDCAEKSPNKPRAHVNLGVALTRAGKSEECREAMKKAIALGQIGNEEFVRAATNIVASYVQENRPEDAITKGQEYLKAIRTGLNGAGLSAFMYNLAVAYTLKDHFTEAYEVYSMGFLHGKDEPFLFDGLKRLLIKANQDANGREQLQLSGDEIEVPMRMAVLMVNLRKYDRARMFLEQAEKFDPDDKRVRSIRAELTEITEKNHQATTRSDISSDMACTTSTSVRNLLWLAEFIVEQYAPLRSQAGHILETANQMEPANPFVSASKARWHLAMNQPEAAVKTAEALIPRYPDFPPLLEVAGNSYLAINRPDKAAMVFTHLLSIYPGHPQWQSFTNEISQQINSAS